MNRFGLRDEIVEFIASAAQTSGLSEIILFGSRAKGSYSEKSDIDLAISGGNMNQFIGLMEEECPTLLLFDFVDMSMPMSDDLRERISEEGVRLYG